MFSTLISSRSWLPTELSLESYRVRPNECTSHRTQLLPHAAYKKCNHSVRGWSASLGCDRACCGYILCPAHVVVTPGDGAMDEGIDGVVWHLLPLHPLIGFCPARLSRSRLVPPCMCFVTQTELLCFPPTTVAPQRSTCSGGNS